VVAAIAASAVAAATLKYLNDGGPIRLAKRFVGDGFAEGCPGVVTWTTQPAGGALSLIKRHGACPAPESRLFAT
jgi:hypothetical protein